MTDKLPLNLTELSKVVHAANIKWWQDPATGLPIKRNRGELIALFHSEISEASDGAYFNQMDDKLPHRKSEEVELIDALIRILDYSAGFKHNLHRAGLRYGILDFENLNQIMSYVTVGDEFGARGFDGIHSRISAVLELERKGHPSEQISDALLIVILMILQAIKSKDYDAQTTFNEKMAYNAQREDHKHEARLIAGGKQF